MRIPSRPHRLTPVLSVESAEIDACVWQAHVLKHPFGLGALYNLASLNGDRRWNTEGWDETEPPTITRSERAELVAKIGALAVDGHRCTATRLAREEFRGEHRHEDTPCYECAPPLAARCAEVTRGIGERYASVVDGIFLALQDAVEVRRTDAYGRVTASARRGPVDGTLVSVGRLGTGGRGARINDASGARVELYLDRGALRWRTTYRVRFAGLSDRASFLLDMLPAIARTPLSDRVLVPRRWWETSP